MPGRAPGFEQTEESRAPIGPLPQGRDEAGVAAGLELGLQARTDDRESSRTSGFAEQERVERQPAHLLLLTCQPKITRPHRNL
jgi:hypothetical protein